MFTTFTSVFRKELLHILRDFGTLRLVIVLPVMQLLLFGFIDQTVHDIATVVVDQDHTVHSRELMDRLRATKTFTITQITSDPGAAREAIIAGRANVGVVTPPDYHNLRTREKP